MDASYRLLCRTCRIASGTKRHASVDGGTTLRLRVDGKRSVHQLQPLLHADETKTLAILCCFEVKARTGILNREMNLIRRSRQAYFELSYSTVFRRIVQGFLRNSEQAQRNVRRQRAEQVVGFEVNLHLLLRGEFFAEASHGHSNTQILQSCRVQLV